jgi:hypothetical protein
MMRLLDIARNEHCLFIQVKDINITLGYIINPLGYQK